MGAVKKRSSGAPGMIVGAAMLARAAVLLFQHAVLSFQNAGHTARLVRWARIERQQASVGGRHIQYVLKIGRECNCGRSSL
ncbi:MAG: hypothetical protein AAF517_03240 [Planctomycetota bacterium]